ncbi:Arginyl-tRNA--protein transferase 1 [Mactra antiquata]
MAKSIVEYFAEHEAYRCGYCGNTDTNYSHGMWAHALTVQDYQDLLDRGWRRSGKYCYKPTMDVTCCPMYTIRCEALNFKLRKSHKKVIKKMNKYLIEGVKPKCDKNDEDGFAIDDRSGVGEKHVAMGDDKPGTSESDVKPTVIDEKPGTSQPEPETSSAGNKNIGPSSKTPKPGDGIDPNKPKCKKAKERRKEKKLAKLASKGQSEEQAVAPQETKPSTSKSNDGKTLEELLSEPEKAEHCAHKLEVRLVRSSPKSQLFEDTLKETHEVYHKYQVKIHGDAPDKPSMRQFTRFLIDSPLEEEHPGGTLPLKYGSFHHQYILDGKIICVGVIDILPSLVSSKYLYYDPDYYFLSLGTYSALREIALVQELHKQSQEMIYYYMGYYIQSCPKMIYKGQYYPSYLLCPETYTWHPVEKCAPKLDINKYSRFEEDQTVVDKNAEIDLENLLVLHKRQLMTYPIYKMLSKGENDDLQEVREYAGFVGKKASSSLVLFRK